MEGTAHLSPTFSTDPREMSRQVPDLTVRRVSDDTLPDLNVRIVGISEDPAGLTGRSLLFQRALRFNQQDHELGMDTYAISNEDQATAYGSISGYQLRPPWLELHFTK